MSKKRQRHQCQNCNWSTNLALVGSEDKRLIQPIKDLDQRVETGEVVPLGECPECGAVVRDSYKYYLVTGRIPYSDEDDSRIFQCSSRDRAVELFTVDMYCMTTNNDERAAKRGIKQRKAQSLDVIYINSVFSSSTPITEE